MRRVLDHIPGQTFHGRQAEGVENAFSYDVDYILIDPADEGPFPSLFARNAARLASLRDRDHGGPPGAGRGLAWVHEVLARDLPGLDCGPILLLAQPRVLGHTFNPVSFWLVHDRGDNLRAVIAEVTNTYGDRHSYLCHADDLEPIGPHLTVETRKCLHVSPFQPTRGRYRFRFDIRDDRIAIWISYHTDAGRLMATLSGPRMPVTNRGLLRAALRRPFGTRRVLALIHWQAFRLWRKGANFRDRPDPPQSDVSR